MNKKARRILCMCAALVLLMGGMLYYGRYQDALWRAEEGLYGKALSVLELPFLTVFHDPGFVEYLKAGELMEYGEYERAEKMLRPLAQRNYRNASQLLQEAEVLAENRTKFRKYENS